VGQRNRPLERLLHRQHRRDWAFLTAWNPRSRRLPRWRNERRQRALARLLPLALLGAGVAADGRWAEESLLAFGVPPGRARRLARQFGQNAVVVGRRGVPARLLWCTAAERGYGLIA
jgi:hypothetical protein